MRQPGDVACISDTTYPFQPWTPVFADTVGQYTGLKDKNGVEVYEGDILRDTATSKVESVEYSAPAFVIVDSKRYFYWTYHADDYEVIGNIHDNGDLLTQESKP